MLLATPGPAAAARERRVVVAWAIGIAALAWAWLAGMDTMSDVPGPWTATDVAMTFAMWVVMMVAMMAGPVAPALALFAGMQRTRPDAARGAVSMFAGGYALGWIAFSAAATLAQWMLDRAGWLSTDMSLANARVGGMVLILAGLYSWTPLARTCLRHCQSPLGFFMTHWREGAIGALRMGIAHGVYCVGCCWALMVVLFAVGVMNLAWVALLTLIVMLMKLGAAAAWTTRAAGAALVIAGLAISLSA